MGRESLETDRRSARTRENSDPTDRGYNGGGGGGGERDEVILPSPADGQAAGGTVSSMEFRCRHRAREMPLGSHSQKAIERPHGTLNFVSKKQN